MRARIFTPIAALSLLLAGSLPGHSQMSGTQVQTPPSKSATPIEIPDKKKPLIRKMPSKSATPIEIPDKKKPLIRKMPSKSATPIEIPDKK